MVSFCAWSMPGIYSLQPTVIVVAFESGHKELFKKLCFCPTIPFGIKVHLIQLIYLLSSLVPNFAHHFGLHPLSGTSKIEQQVPRYTIDPLTRWNFTFPYPWWRYIVACHKDWRTCPQEHRNRRWTWRSTGELCPKGSRYHGHRYGPQPCSGSSQQGEVITIIRLKATSAMEPAPGREKVQINIVLEIGAGIGKQLLFALRDQYPWLRRHDMTDFARS